MPVPPGGDAGPVGLVVGGGGARGAYEAGALSVLVPAMERTGAAPRVLVGTSSGAVNVVALAGAADAGWVAATAQTVALWSQITLARVADVPRSIARDQLRIGAQVLGLPVRLPSLLDTAVQRGTLDALLPLEGLHRAVQRGTVDAVAVVTTSVESGGTVVFVERGADVVLPEFDAGRNIEYVDAELTVDHVLASAAVPIGFEPVYVPTPAGAAGWYVDGGLRLNVPLKPALRLGCARLGVVATAPAGWPAPVPRAPSDRPDVFAVAALALRALLADRMVEDLMRLAAVNRPAGAGGTGPRQRVPFMFAGPPVEQAHALAHLATQVAADHYAGLAGLRHPDVALLGRLVGGNPDDHGELLSYLLFEPPFTARAAALGADHARAQLGPTDRPRGWRTTVRGVSRPAPPGPR